NDPNDIMYPEALDRQYLNEPYELSSTAGYLHFLPVCSIFDLTSYSFEISLDDPNGLDVYFVPSTAEYENYGVKSTFNHYSDRGCWAENVVKFSGTCKGVSNQGGLLVVMPDQLKAGLVTVSVNLQEIAFTGGESNLSQFNEETGIFSGSTFIGTAEVRTDKSSYNFGDTLRISGKLSEPSRGSKVSVIITSPFGQMVSKSTLTTTSSGEFQTMTSIPNFYQAGSYTISVYNNQGEFLGDTRVNVGLSSGLAESEIFEEIPESEIAKLIQSVLATHREFDRETLYRRVLDFYDLKRLTSTVRKSLARILSDEGIDLVEPDTLGSEGSPRKPSSQTHSKYQFELLGENFVADSLVGILVIVLRTIQEIDPEFLSRLSQKSGRVRPIVARNPRDLYPGRPDLSHYSREITDGWFVGSNYSKRDVDRILQIVCTSGGLVYGKDLRGPAIEGMKDRLS
ncbi:MAG: hypothetical protein IIA72_03270, partial [Proteobacteria bacterium]|nr:hypothetical protein [Pseudomonadota bacterium]